jgi:hypothetical protein
MSGAPAFQRFQVTYRGGLGVEVGIFVAVDHLRRAGRLGIDEQLRYVEIEDWFHEHLPDPPFYGDGNSIGAVTWFKPDLPPTMTSRLGELCHILDAHAVANEQVWSTSPGAVVYEDDHQIGVIPAQRSAPTPMPEGLVLGPTTAASKRHLVERRSPGQRSTAPDTSPVGCGGARPG